ncbi:MAG: chorismate synthase [Actinobacteria bacterium RBG_16_64_13]|nr:MAG: chorismate synthase [Actinobacteria bacterium RBG_16_64_13]
MSILRMTTAGESHGPGEACIVEGIPSGLPLTRDEIDVDLARRQRGYGRGDRMAIETDRCRFVAGVRHGRTLGSPICLLIENGDYANWVSKMSPDPMSEETTSDMGRFTLPRPGHADLAGVAKYGHTDIRDVLERASARETVGRVAGGAVCKRLLQEAGVTVRARVLSIGGVRVAASNDMCRAEDIDWDAVEASPVGCEERAASDLMCARIDEARGAGESLGGVFEVWCWGVCPGVGGYASMEDRLDGRLAGALASIPAIKGVQMGVAFDSADEVGSRVHDPILLMHDGDRRWIGRNTNRAGGIEGGMTTGMPVVLRAAMKPIPTLTTPLASVDIATLELSSAHVERSDVTAVPAARVVGEAMAAYVLAAAYLSKFGGDSVKAFAESVRSYEAGLEERGLWRRF